ncbi:hypothetical protein Ahy_B09g100046 isoform B [Arachis hypogaea]|uniref:Gnk2-homologous domain-containing protein n=1 Tax=Arachis hypogaea TaxID=3818 RepID=A0A444XWL0_ARAHY|nr:hypothetical protein Ahy_B09g100046 isoform B [Arachis hypogaea]
MEIVNIKWENKKKNKMYTLKEFHYLKRINFVYKQLPISCLIIIIFISKVNADATALVCGNTVVNSRANSNYAKNLNTLLSTLTSNTKINYGFYNSSYGQNTDRVNAIGLCNTARRQLVALLG